MKSNNTSAKLILRLINWSKFLRIKWVFCFDVWKYYRKNSTHRIYLPKVEIKDYNIMINGKNFFKQSVKKNFRTYDNIRKIEAGQRDDYTTGCL